MIESSGCVCVLGCATGWPFGGRSRGCGERWALDERPHGRARPGEVDVSSLDPGATEVVSLTWWLPYRI